MFDGSLLERAPVTDFREAEKVVSILTLEVKQCIVKPSETNDPIGAELIDTGILLDESSELSPDRKTTLAWFDQKTLFARRLLHALCLVSKFSVFQAAPLTSLENHPVDALKLTDGLLWLRWRYEDLRVDLQNIAGYAALGQPSEKTWRQPFDSPCQRLNPSHISLRRRLNRLDRQLLQIVGEVRLRFKSVLATQGWGIPGAYLRVRYHVQMPEDVINLQRDTNGDYAVWSLRLNNANFHGMLPTAKLTLMRRQNRKNFMIGICETSLFAIENLDGRSSLRGNRQGLLLFRPLTQDQQIDADKVIPAARLYRGNAIDQNDVQEQTENIAIEKRMRTFGPVTGVILTQIEWRPKSGEVKNVLWPWDTEMQQLSTRSDLATEIICS